MTAIFLNTQFIKAEIAKLIDQFPELVDDETLRLDMIEAETGLFRMISMLVRHRAEKAAMAEGLDAYIEELVDRKARFERSANGVKGLIQGLMRAAGQDKISLPEATVFTTKPRTSVEITDIAALPQGWFETVRKPKSADIKAALERGEEIPGAMLVTGERGITIRTK